MVNFSAFLLRSLKKMPEQMHMIHVWTGKLSELHLPVQNSRGHLHKYSRDPLYQGSVYHGIQYSTIGSWLPKFVKQIVDPSRERNIKSAPVRVIV